MLTEAIFRRNHECITNEANALRLVSDNVIILVPRLLEYGELLDGWRYLVVGFIDSLMLKEVYS